MGKGSFRSEIKGDGITIRYGPSEVYYDGGLGISYCAMCPFNHFESLDQVYFPSFFTGSGKITRPKPKQLRADQDEALAAVRTGLETAGRGKLLMVCGTGKTLASHAGNRGSIPLGSANYFRVKPRFVQVGVAGQLSRLA